MKKKKFINSILAITLVTSLAATMPMTAFALDESQADDYTQGNLNNPNQGTGGTVYETGTFSVNTDYTDNSFTTTSDPQDTKFPEYYPQSKIYSLTDEKIEPIVAALLKSMTYEEKIYMISMNEDPEDKDGVGYLTGVPRLGVPESRMNDGPSGVNAAQGSQDAYVETTIMPLQLTSSMTWSEDLINKFGAALGKEHVSTGIGWQLGMQMDLARTPHWARAKDTFGEDYYLASKLTVAETKGLQANGGIAMAKHIGAYSTDGDTSLWLKVDEQTLHTAYLFPFEMAAKKAQLASIMGTYNRLNGYYTSSNRYLQISVLRNQWNWAGAMCPDWGADKDEFSMPFGTDLFQSNYSSINGKYRSAVSQDILSMEDLNNSAGRVLYAYGVAGYLNLVEIDENGYAKEEKGRTNSNPIRLERTYDEDRASGLYDDSNEVTLEIAEKGIVLLKNENQTLPLTKSDYTGENSVALIGYGATNLIAGTGGERSFGVLQYMSTPYESMKDIAGDNSNISAAVLDNVHGTTIPAGNVYADASGTVKGWVASGAAVNVTPGKMIGSTDNGAALVNDVYLSTTNVEGQRSFKNQANGDALENGEAASWTGYVEAPEDGKYSFVIQTNGGTAKVSIEADGKTVTAQASDGISWDFYTTEGLNYSTTSATLTAGSRYKVTVTANQTSTYRDAGVKLNWILPSQNSTDHANALKAAKDNDTVIMFTRTGTTGHGPVFNTDFDISLDEKDTIKEIQKVAKENGNKFVLVTFGRSGYSFEGDWLDETDALLCPFYAGQSAGKALAEILTGKVNPSGKLTMTLPKTNADTLLTYGYYGNSESTTNYNTDRAGDQSSKNGYTANYSENLNFGYRWYDSDEATGASYQYPFGYGLSYTTFKYSNLKVAKNTDNTFDVTVDVTNTGSAKGDEIVQLYLGAANVPSDVHMAEKQLVAFDRVEDITVGQTKTATLHIDERMLSYWDSDISFIARTDGTKDKWVLATGDRDILVGGSSDDLTLKSTINVGQESSGGYTPIDNGNGSGNGDTDTDDGNGGTDEQKTLEVGLQKTVGGIVYKVTSSGKSTTTVKITDSKSNKKSIVIPSTVIINGVTCKVTTIGKNAYRNSTKLTKITIGKNIKKIDATAFYGCDELKTIVIKSTKITKVDKAALKGINKSVIIKVPSSKFKEYKKLFRNKGLETVTIVQN